MAQRSGRRSHSSSDVAALPSALRLFPNLEREELRPVRTRWWRCAREQRAIPDGRAANGRRERAHPGCQRPDGCRPLALALLALTLE